MESSASAQKKSLKTADAFHFSKFPFGFVGLSVFQMCKEFYLQVLVFLQTPTLIKKD